MDISSLNNYFELYGGMAIFIVVLLEYMNLPGFPAGIIMPLAGIYAAHGGISLLAAIAISVLAGEVGSWILYFLGMYGGNACNGVQREHNKKLNNGLPILHKVPPKRDYGRYFCIMAEKGGTSHGGLTEKLSPFFHAKKQEVNAYGR